MIPGSYDFLMRQGSTWIQSIVWKDSNGTPVDLTGYVARMQIRQQVNSETIIVSLTTENNRIELDATNGKLTLLLDATTTAAINQFSGVYDLELESSDGTVTAILAGRVKIAREVTR